MSDYDYPKQMQISNDDRMELAHCEQGVIGAAMNNPQILDLIGEQLRGEHFLSDDIGRLYEGILSLHGSGVNISDQIGLKSLLGLMKIRTNITAYTIALWSQNYFDYNAKYYADMIITAWRHRQLWATGIELAKRFDISNALSVNQNDRDDIAYLETKIAAIYQTRDLNTVQSVTDIAEQYLAELEEVKQSANGILTGINPIDEAIGKTLPSELMVIAARPGCGKTAIALQIAEHNAAHGTVLFVSLEMRNKELVSRSLCRMAGIDSKLLRDSEQGQERTQAIAAIRESSKLLKGMPLYVWSPPSATVSQIRSKAKYVKAAHGLKMMIVDYIGIVKVAGDFRKEDRHLQIGEITRTLKEIGKEFNIPVIALAQLNRDAANKKPELNNLRESGSIEQDADIVLLIHHEKDQRGRIDQSYIITAKHRHSDMGEIRVGWNPQLTMFTALSTEWTG